MFDFKNDQAQALRCTRIIANTNLLMKKLFDEFCDKLFGLNQLKKWNLELDQSDCQLTHKNSPQQNNEDYYRCS